MKTLSALFMMFVLMSGASANEMRVQAEKLERDGNWKEAYELRVKLLREVDDNDSGKDLSSAVEMKNQLNEQHAIDSLLDELIDLKKDNAEFMLAAGNVYLGAVHYGYFEDNVFKRGYNGRGEWRQVQEQDRLRALQCFMQAWQKVDKGSPEELRVLRSLDVALMFNLHSGYMWRLYLKTDLGAKPDYTEQIDVITSTGAPVGKNGEPTYIDVPESWVAAKSDGERWRWLLAEIARLSPADASGQKLKWLQFCQQNYGVNTLASYGWWSQPDVKERDGMLQASTLKDEETIAKLAGGVKRFTLREDFQYIPRLRELMKLGKDAPCWQAGDLLVRSLMDRNQFVAAAETLEEVIRMHKNGGDVDGRKKLLEQIRGNWSRFGVTPTYFASAPVEVPFVFRNAKSVKLSIMEVDEGQVMNDIIAYLEKNPLEIDYQKVNFSQIGQRLLEEEGAKYVGKELRSWTEELKPADGHVDTDALLDLGKLAPGCYFLKSEMQGGNTAWTVVWVRDLVIMKRAEAGAEVFYLVDAAAGAPVVGELEFFGYQAEYLDKAKGKRRFNIITHHFKRKTDENGRLELKLEKGWERDQWHVIARSGERKAYLADSHLSWNNYNNSEEHVGNNTMVITDRPVYRPGQKVHVKLWAGQARYDLGDVSTYAGKSAHVEIRDGRNEEVYKNGELVADEYGGITFDFDLEEEAALGNYQVIVRGLVPNSYSTFRVEEYKKPEFEVKVEAPSDPVALGEAFEATVIASYYHGAPVTEATVKIKVERNFYNNRWFPAGPWDWLYGPGYWWCYGEYPWYPGWARWGCIRPPAPWWGGRGRSGAPELVFEQTSPIGADGKVNVKIDSAIAKLVHGDEDHRYSITAEVVDASRRTIVGNGAVLAAREPYDVTVWLDRGYARVGDKVTGYFAARTLDGKVVEGDSKAILYSTSVDADGKITEKEVASWKPEGGKWVFEASVAGQYRMAVEFTDKKGRKREGATVFSVRGADGAGDFRYADLELIPDNGEYNPEDLVKLLVNVNKADSRVWLFIRSAQGKHEETRIIQIDGKSQVVEIPLTLRDMPNIFIDGVTVADGSVHMVTREIVLPPQKRKLGVEVIPAKDKLKPREKTSLTIRITDSEGKPYKGSAAISIYDKSLEYISGGTNVGEIVPFYWGWKRHHYGANVFNSQGLSGDSIQMPGTTFMQHLGMFGGIHSRNREMNYSRSLQGAAGAMRLEDKMMPAEIAMSEEAEGFADSGKKEDGSGGEAPPEVMVRSEFADLLKWVGSVETDEKGEAVIEMEMPDNLTTWKIKTWAMGHGTRVGEGSAEIVTSKDLIIRLQAPRFFVEKDEVTLSAVVHNYHEEAKDVAVSLELDGKNLESTGAMERRAVIPSKGETRIDWTVKAVSEGEVTLRMKAICEDDSDAMEMKFPVYVHGMVKTESYSRSIAPDGDNAVIDFTLPEERRPSETKLTLNYSPSVASAMIDALPYLASYPYGCTEQTLNRFVPTTVVHHILKDQGYDLGAIKDKRINLNPQQLGDPKERAAQWQPNHPHWNPVWDVREVAKMEQAGIARLRDHQNPDGGWGWFSAYGNQSYAHTTAVVMHGLILARDNGAKVPADMIDRGLAWLVQHEVTEADKIDNWDKRDHNTKQKADSIDALVRRVLGEGGNEHKAMHGYLFRDKSELPVYAKALLGLELHRTKDMEKRDEVIRNIRQYLKRDEENQTAYLDLGNDGYWWYWYGSEFEAQAWFLKLLAAAEPDGADARGLVKYLINNRRHGHYWNSTRDTAYCIEAIGDYLKASAEGDPDMTVEVLLDGKILKSVEITKENLFTFDNSVIVAGDIVTSGKHTIELRKKGKGPLYANAYLEYFTLEDFITKAGLEVKVERTYYKLVEDNKVIDAVDSEGQAIDQKRSRYKRELLKTGDELKSGDLVEVELGIDSKNDYEYLLFEDWKAAGMEAVEVRSGYNANGLGAYMELRDEKVSLFVQFLPRGRHNLSYRLRAEIPGKFSALPTRAEAMYAPELKANSDEMKIKIGE